MRIAAIAVVTLSLGLMSASASYAQDESDNEAKAQALYAEGESAYASGNYEAALESFNAAYELIPVAGLLFNIGQCHRKLGHHIKAAEFFQRYLVEETDEIGNRAEVKELLVEENKLAEEERAALAAAQPETPETPAPATPTEPQIYEEPVFWGIAGGVALAAIVGGAVLVAVATAPPPSGSLGSFDLRNAQ